MDEKPPKPFRVAKVFGLNVPAYKLALDENTRGLYGPQKQAIAVDSGLKGDDLEFTLLHEILHALYDRLYIDAQISDQLAEMIIENTCTVIKENFRVKWREPK